MLIIWKENQQHPGLIDGFDESGKMLCWITQRPSYCDRGHWQLNIEIYCGLDSQDGFPRYFMRLETAKQEAELFLDWRLNKVRAES